MHLSTFIFLSATVTMSAWFVRSFSSPHRLYYILQCSIVDIHTNRALVIVTWFGTTLTNTDEPIVTRP